MKYNLKILFNFGLALIFIFSLLLNPVLAQEGEGPAGPEEGPASPEAPGPTHPTQPDEPVHPTQPTQPEPKQPTQPIVCPCVDVDSKLDIGFDEYTIDADQIEIRLKDSAIWKRLQCGGTRDSDGQCTATYHIDSVKVFAKWIPDPGPLTFYNFEVVDSPECNDIYRTKKTVIQFGPQYLSLKPEPVFTERASCGRISGNWESFTFDRKGVIIPISSDIWVIKSKCRKSTLFKILEGREKESPEWWKKKFRLAGLQGFLRFEIFFEADISISCHPIDKKIIKWKSPGKTISASLPTWVWERTTPPKIEVPQTTPPVKTEEPAPEPMPTEIPAEAPTEAPSLLPEQIQPPPSLFYYLERVRDVTGRELTQVEKLGFSCQKILEKAKPTIQEPWIEKIKHSETGEEIEITLPQTKYAWDFCHYLPPELTLSLLETIRTKAENLINVSQMNFIDKIIYFIRGSIERAKDLLKKRVTELLKEVEEEEEKKKVEEITEALVSHKDPCVCIIESFKETLDVKKAGQKWRRLKEGGESIVSGDILSTGFNSKAILICKVKGKIRKLKLESLTYMEMSEYCEDPDLVEESLKIKTGEVKVEVKYGDVKADFKVKTPNITTGVKG